MGRRKTIIYQLLFIFLFLNHTNYLSQTKITGNIFEENKKPIIGASAILQDSLNNIISYSYSNNEGFYNLEVRKVGIYKIAYSSLGFKKINLPIKITSLQIDSTINVILTEQAFKLNEIIVKAEKPITIGKDTIRFKTKFFAKGNEQTVEQLLKTIPGLNIDSEGTIKVGNQEIEKLMVDGDDFFEKGYKILSKNMPAYPIIEVEVLKNYSNNRLLKGIENSKKVALNLKLNEKSKRIWFGNTELGYGIVSENNYDIKGNLMNFGKKNKYFFLANANNIGYNATGDIEQLVRPFRINEPASVGDNQKTENILNLSNNNLAFDKQRSNFNNAELLSLNAIFNPNKKLKIKTLGFLNWDEIDFFRNNTETVNINDVNFTNSEDLKVRNKQKTVFGKLDLIYNAAKNKMLETTTKFNFSNFNDVSNLIFNANSTVENLKSKNTLFDQKINYTQKFQKTKAFLLTGRYIFEDSPQSYDYNQFLFQEIFSNTSAENNVKQTNKNSMQFLGLNSHLFDRKQNGNLLELQFGNEFRKDILQTSFVILEDENIVLTPTLYQNKTNYIVNNIYAKGKYIYNINNFKIISNLGVHQIFNKLENNTTSKNENLFFVNPSIGFNWEINTNNKLTTTYSYNVNNAQILDVYDAYILNGFRSFIKGTGNFNQLNNSNLFLNYQLGNWSDRFFASIFGSYTKNHDFFSTNTTLKQNYSQSEKILIKDRTSLNVNAELDFYFKMISSNLKLDVGYDQNQFKNKINSADLRNVISNNYNYGFELRSGFSGVFNYHFGSQWNISEIKSPINNSFTNNTSFLDLSFVFSDKFSAQLKTEYYDFDNFNTTESYYFLDFNVRYSIIKDKLSLNLVGKNLFNTKTFRNVSISDFSSSITKYSLLPRFAVLKMEYRF